MVRTRGEAAPAAWFAEGVIAEASPDKRRRLITAYLSTLAKIHAVDWRRAGLSFLLDRAEGDGLIEREVNWYWDGLKHAGEVEAMGRFDGVRRWLVANQPEIPAPVLCHGDTNFTNNLFDGDSVSAVLDWEMAFIGAPEADLAYALHAMESLGDNRLKGIPTAEEMVDEYQRFSGQTARHMEYYRLFAVFRVALILTMGKRAFPPDFQAPFADYIERTAARMYEQAKVLNADV